MSSEDLAKIIDNVFISINDVTKSNNNLQFLNCRSYFAKNPEQIFTVIDTVAPCLKQGKDINYIISKLKHTFPELKQTISIYKDNYLKLPNIKSFAMIVLEILLRDLYEYCKLDEINDDDDDEDENEDDDDDDDDDEEDNNDDDDDKRKKEKTTLKKKEEILKNLIINIYENKNKKTFI